VRTGFRKSFARDLKNIRDESLHRRIREAIEQVEAATRLADVPNLAKMRTGGHFYRIRVGDYRIGIAVEGEEVEFVRCLDRPDVYRYFP